MSKSSATDQHGNWLTVPETQPKDEIRVRAEEAAKRIWSTPPKEQDDARLLSIIESTLRAALAESAAEIAELVKVLDTANEVMKDGPLVDGTFREAATNRAARLLAKYTKPKETT